MPDRPERVGRTLIHNGTIIDVYQDHMRLPDGSSENFDFIKHKGAAAVIPVMDDGRIIMVRQYRNAIDSYTLEIPAGGLNGIPCRHRGCHISAQPLYDSCIL